MNKEITQKPNELDLALGLINRTWQMNPFEGFDAAWIGLVRIANLLPGNSEHKRMLGLLELMPDESLRWVLDHEALDRLLDLEPPLETLLASQHERLEAERAKSEIDVIRHKRKSDPREAMKNLAHTLKRIRNKRAHGFKAPDRPRDEEILGASVEIIRRFAYSAAERLYRPRAVDERTDQKALWE